MGMAMRIDMHTHIVGNGSGGSGCWLRSQRSRWPLQALMLRHIGLPLSALSGDLEGLYVARLLELVRSSSLDAAVILAHEQPYDRNGRVIGDVGTMHIPNDYVLALARQHREFLPAVSIHPARPDALEELDRCLDAGAVMMKCLPNCQNIDGRDRRYTRFWERMAEAGLPLLAHTGGEHTVEVVNAELADPRTLDWPLQCGVTVIAAHCGTKSGPFDPQYFHHFAAMLQKHPRLYGDNSALTVPIRSRVLRECMKEPVASRNLHGSDFPVPVYGHWMFLRGFISWEAFCESERITNPLERDAMLKSAMGFAPETFTRVNRLLRLPAPLIPALAA